MISLSRTSQKGNEVSESEVNLADFIKILQSLEKMYRIGSGENARMVSFIKKLRYALRPYKYMGGSEFLDLVRNSNFLQPKTSRMNKHRYKKEIPSLNTIMPFHEVRARLSKGTLTKEQMISIAERQFGFSKGTLQKLKKEEIKSQIESAMQNIETLKIIQKKAVE